MFTTGEAARILGVTMQTVVNWTRSGRLPCMRAGRGRRRIAPSVLRAFLEEQGLVSACDDPGLLERLRPPPPPDFGPLPALICCDPTGRVAGWNAAATGLLGWSETETLGRDLSFLPASVPGMPVSLPDLLAGPEEESLSLRLSVGCRDGRRVDLDLTLSWFHDARGRRAGGILLLQGA